MLFLFLTFTIDLIPFQSIFMLVLYFSKYSLLNFAASLFSNNTVSEFPTEELIVSSWVFISLIKHIISEEHKLLNLRVDSRLGP